MPEVNLGKVTKESFKTIEGTLWRNKHTFDLAKIKIIPSPRPREVEIYDMFEWNKHPIDSGLNCPMAWAHYGEKWESVMEHWVRVDNLSHEERFEYYRKRVGYCKERMMLWIPWRYDGIIP